MKKKIAIPAESGKLCAHFGHCEKFYVAVIDNNKIKEEQEITPPAMTHWTPKLFIHLGYSPG